MMRLPQMSQPPRLKNRDSAQREFNDSLRDLLALLDEERLLGGGRYLAFSDYHWKSEGIWR